MLELKVTGFENTDLNFSIFESVMLLLNMPCKSCWEKHCAFSFLVLVLVLTATWVCRYFLVVLGFSPDSLVWQPTLRFITSCQSTCYYISSGFSHSLLADIMTSMPLIFWFVMCRCKGVIKRFVVSPLFLSVLPNV